MIGLSLRQWVALFTHFAIGFVTGYLLMTLFLWIVVKLGHALMWILLLGPLAFALLFGIQHARLKRGLGLGT